MNQESLKQVIGVYCQLQSLLHSIDELEDSVVFKHELKQKTNQYKSYIERRVNDIDPALKGDEGDYFVSIVQELDRVINDVVVEILIEA